MRTPFDPPTGDVLAHRREATPDRTAVVDADADRRLTYREFDRRVDRLADDLASLSGPVGVLLGTRPAFAALLFAAMRTGTVLVPLSVRETPDELAAKVERADVSAIVCERETETLAIEIGGDSIRTVDEPADDRLTQLGGSESESDGDRDANPTPSNVDDTQLICFTSGTGGRPKGVRLTIGTLVASATASAFRLGVLPEDRWLCCLPMYHMGGLAPAVRSTLYGTALVIQREFDPDATARALEEYDVTGVSLVPTMCKRLLDSGWEPPASLRFVLLGGAPASQELLERCLAAGVPVHPTYGTTETASQIATATPEQVRAYPGTVGQPLVFTDVTIVDDDGRPVEVGETGELAVAGPTVTPGYLDEDRAASAFGPYGLYTGDLGYRDEDGRLWILGRRADRIVTGGENVDPDEVAAALRDHPGIEAAAVVGLPDEEWGERVAALLVPVDGRDDSAVESRRPTPESVRDHCESRLADFKRPKTIGYADSLPRTASGTVDREAVREQLVRDGSSLAERD